MDVQSFNDVYVSLGPACFTASVLKFANLRRFSLPFDWARSGSCQWEDSLTMSADDFYIRNISQPNHRMVQVGDPSTSASKMSELSYLTPAYGYPYFFNPHVKLGHDLHYMLRCLRRLEKIYSAKDVFIKFVLSKHTDKPEESFYFNSNQQLVEYFEDRLSLFGLNGAVHLIEISSSSMTTPFVSEIAIGNSVILYKVDVHSSLYYGSDHIRQNIVGKLYKSLQPGSTVLQFID